MRSRCSPWAWLAALIPLTAAAFVRDAPGQDADAEKISALVKQLGDGKFTKREAATKGLVAAGEKALPVLRQAEAATTNPETRQRLQKVIQAVLLAAGTSKATGLKLALIDAGEFDMGSPKTEPGRRPEELPHRVKITRPFLLGTHEVTQEEYRRVMATNPSWFADSGGGKKQVQGKATDRFPVEQVTWFDAIEFCNRLSRLDGYEPYYRLAEPQREGGSLRSARVTVAGGNGYRLPTEAEWEFACRAGSARAFHFGAANTGKEANLKPGPAVAYGTAPQWPVLNRTTTVGSYPANARGLHDLHGNAAEWCWDWHDGDYYKNSPAADPTGPDRGTHRVVRGGSWVVNERSCRSASRFWLPPGEHSYYVGFRVARTP